MAENNVTWKDGAGFSEECTKQINSYFKTFESIILLSRDRESQLWRYADLDKQACNCALAEAYGETYGGELIDAIRLDVFYIPGLLPELQNLRDRVLKLQQAAQRVLDISFCKDFGEMCIKSTLVVIEALDDEIGNLLEEEGIPEIIADRVLDQFENEMTEFQLQLQDDLQEDKMTAVVSCPPAPVKEAEKPAVEAEQKRESFRFDVTIGVKNEFEKMFNFLQGYLDSDNDMEAAKTALKSCLFGTPDNRYKIKIKSRGQAAIASFFGEMAFQAGHDRRATLEFTILKWFVKHDGTSLSSKYVQNNTRTNSTSRSFVQELFTKKKGNVYGVTEKG